MDYDKIIDDILYRMRLMEEIDTCCCEGFKAPSWYSPHEAKIAEEKYIKEQFGLEIVAYQEGE